MESRGQFCCPYRGAILLEPVSLKREVSLFDLSAPESPRACAKRLKQDFFGAEWDDYVPTFDTNTPAEFPIWTVPPSWSSPALQDEKPSGAAAHPSKALCFLTRPSSGIGWAFMA
jgi:hypothetical protein